MAKLTLTTEPKIINTTKYSTIDIILIYSTTDNYEHMFELNLLKNLLTFSSKKYKTEQSFKKNLLDNLIINYSVNYLRINENIYFKFCLTIPNPKKVKFLNIKKAIDFFISTVYEPNTINCAFNKTLFDREVDYLKARIIDKQKNIYHYSFSKFNENLDFKFHQKSNLSTNISKLFEITPASLYKYYEEIILNNQPLVFIYGDIEERELDFFFKNQFLNQKKKIEIPFKFNCFLKPTKTHYIEEKSSYDNSALFMGYSILNMTEKDKIYLLFLNEIFKTGLGVNLFFQKLRIEKNLVYSIYSDIYLTRGLFVIETYFQKEKKDEIIKCIQEVMDSIETDFVIKIRECLLEKMHYEMIRSLDLKYIPLDDTINKLLKTNYSIEELFTIFKNLNIQEFINFYNRLNLNLVYFLEGGNNE